MSDGKTAYEVYIKGSNGSRYYVGKGRAEPFEDVSETVREMLAGSQIFPGDTIQAVTFHGHTATI